MADQTASFAVRLEDEISGPADSAAAALSKLDQQIAADTRQLGAMQKAMRNLQGGTSVNVEQFRKLKTAIDAKKTSIAAAQSKFLTLGGSFNTAAKSGKGLEAKIASVVAKAGGLKAPDTGQIGKSFELLSRQAGALPGPLGNVANMLGRVKSFLVPPTVATGIAGISAAMLALVAAAAAATRALYNYGVAQADARRSEQLRLEGLTKMRFFYGRAPGDAKGMQDALDRVAAKVPASRAELAKYNDQLYRMGARGPQLEKALEGVGIKLSTQGEAAASSFAAFAGGAAITGRSVDRLVDKVKSRLGGIAQRQMSSLTVQAEKQKEAFDAMFSGLNIDAFLGAWKEVRDLLGQATASGRALKFMITTLLQPLIGQSTAAAPLVKRFFQGMIIGALQLTIAVLKLRNWFKRTFGESELFKGLDFGWLSVKAGQALVLGLGAAFAFLAASIALVVLPIKTVFSLLFGLGAAIGNVVTWIEKTDFGVLGLSMIDGLIKGLRLEPLLAHMKELASGALTAFKSTLGISSPSKEFMKLGVAIPEGVAAGVDKGAPAADRATQDMVTPRLAAPKLEGARAAGGALSPAARAGNTVSIGELHVHTSGESAKEIVRDIRSELETILEGLLVQVGGTVPA